MSISLPVGTPDNEMGDLHDLRGFIARCEQEGELKRIRAQVDWDLELSHVSKLNEEKGGPALVFENVKGSDIPVLTGAFTSMKRIALGLGMSPQASVMDLANRWSVASKSHIPPREATSGPIMGNIVEGDKVDLLKFPVPRFYPMDGGRYIGTAVSLITKDPETGWVNAGSYRMQLHDRNHVGVQFLPRKHGEMHLHKYGALGKKMPAVAVIGGSPALFLVAGTTIGHGVSEYDLAGALVGSPIEVVVSEVTGLPIPVKAEIVLEGEIDPNPETFRPEGPFGEYTGYYSGTKSTEWPKPCMEVKRVLFRSNPVFWATAVGRPVTDSHVFSSLVRTAILWTELQEMKVPGIKSIYCYPEGLRYMAVISVKQMYPGHSTQVATAALSTTTGHFGLKIVIVVDEDIASDDIGRVIWAICARSDPQRSVQVIKRTRTSSLDPSIPVESRLQSLGSKMIIDACVPYEWTEKPILIELDPKVTQQVLQRWAEYGL